MLVWKKAAKGIALAAVAAVTLLAGCGADKDEALTPDSSVEQNAETQTEQGTEQDGTQADGAAFSYSEGIDGNGHWTGVRALDCVELFAYKGMSIPADVHQVAAADVQAELDYILTEFASETQVTDRAVADGDAVNIDYVGSVDGVPFDGGSTGGMGTDIIAGSLEYIDDFLVQIIGHMPGETMNVEVTFPEAYHEPSLAGKDAVFVTTINYITEAEKPEMTDAFVAEHLTADYGWADVAALVAEIEKSLRTGAMSDYVMERMMTDAAVGTLPDALMAYQVNAMTDYYQGYADAYGVPLEDFLRDYVGVSGMEELLESSRADNENNAVYALVAQAIAEDAGLTVGEAELTTFFTVNMGSGDYASYEAEYGLPYLKQVVLQQLVIDFIIENAVLQ